MNIEQNYFISTKKDEDEQVEPSDVKQLEHRFDTLLLR